MPEELVRVQHGEPIKMSSLMTTRFYLFLDSINYLLLTAERGRARGFNCDEIERVQWTKQRDWGNAETIVSAIAFRYQ